MNRKKIEEVEKLRERAGSVVAYYPKIARAIKSVKACIFLCQLLYWQGKGKKGDWIYKSRKDMLEETGLSRIEQENARKALKKLGIIKEKLEGVPPTVHYKINFSKLNETINKYEAEVDEFL